MITTLEQLYHDQLRDLFSAESQLVAALPELARHASNEEFARALNHHLGQTRNHRARLQDLFSKHGLAAGGEECPAMRGLIREAKSRMDDTMAGEIRDAVLIAAANRIEHYEIAAYGVAKSLATCLGYEDDAEALAETLREESEADEAFTEFTCGEKLAESGPAAVA